MKVAIISANLGSYDPPAEWPALDVPKGVELEIVRLTDENFPPRSLAMTSRLQCGIPKWFGRDFAPTADVIIWIDASCAPTRIAVPWFLKQLGDRDLAAFRHPERRTIRAEYEFMKARMARPGETYLNSRYKGEDLDGMMAFIERQHMSNAPLYATTAFAYLWSPYVADALEHVWSLKARYLLHDQLAFAYVVGWANLSRKAIADNYLKCSALTFLRPSRKRKA